MNMTSPRNYSTTYTVIQQNKCCCFQISVLLNMWHKGRTYKHISVTREQHFPPLRLNTTAEVVHKRRELKLDPDHELWKMLLVGSPANAFDPDLCHSLAKI